MGKVDDLSIYLSYVLRHHPEDIQLEMDVHGWAIVEQLIEGINKKGKYKIDFAILKEIVDSDKKGRYRFDERMEKIKACQGHSISWVTPEMEYMDPPQYLYHGTTTEALQKIRLSGEISKMSRHAVHMQAEVEKAWKSAVRWKKQPVILKIAAEDYYKKGAVFGKTENDVWCTEQVPVEYIVEEIYQIV